MPLSRGHLTPLLIGALLLPGSATLAQGDPMAGWATSEDGLAFATNDGRGEPPLLTLRGSDTFPALIGELPAPDVLYDVSAVSPDGGARVAGWHDGGALPWLDEGRTPLLAKAVIDDGGATWTRQQHIISTPAGCSKAAAEMGGCIHPDLAAALVDLAAPSDSTAEPPPFADAFEPGFFASTGVVDRSGTLFSFAGGSTVRTTVKVRDDDTIVVRGDDGVGDGLGGRLRGHDAFIVEFPANGSGISGPLGPGTLTARGREVREAWLGREKKPRTVFACPPSREGYVVSQFLVGGVGRNVGPAVDSNLEGGVPVFVSEVIPFDCGPLIDGGVLPPEGVPAASLVCGSTRARHTPFVLTVDGRTVTYASWLEEFFAVVTVGLPPETAASLNGRIGGANDGDFFSVGLEGIRLDSVLEDDVMLWLGESQAGIDSYGPKRFHDLELVTDDGSFDLLEQKQTLIGDAFEVGSSQKAETNCPDFDFSFDDVGAIFSDGFESGDVSAWSYTRAD